MPSSVKGALDMRLKLQRVRERLPQRVAAAVYQEASIEMTESKQRVPVDTGTLRASGRVSEPEVTADRVKVLLSFGGAAEEYALIVHEDLEAFHVVGQAKYLSSVLDESAPYLAERVAARVNLSELV